MATLALLVSILLAADLPGPRWTAELGSETYGGPAVAGGKVFVGTNNERPRDAGAAGDRGVVMAFSAADGAFLWQATHPKLAEGRTQDWPLQGVCSTPAVEGDRLYYVSNRGEVVALDARQGDVVWRLDLRSALGVVPRFMSASSPLVVGDLVFVVTGNGPGPDGKAPAAPSFAALDRATGRVRWSRFDPKPSPRPSPTGEGDSSPGQDLVDGQWGSPAYGTLAGRPQVVFPGGDGRLYAFAPETGRLLWSFDANQPPAPGASPGVAPARAALIATPVIQGGRIYIGLGRDPQIAAGPGRLWALEVRSAGDGRLEAVPVWSLGGDRFSTTLSRVAVADGVVYAADFAGLLRAIDAATGQVLWTYDTFAAVWGSPLVAGGRIYLGDQDGDLAVLRAGRTLEVLAEMDLGASISTTPVVRDGVLYVATRSRLVAFAEGAGTASRPMP